MSRALNHDWNVLVLVPTAESGLDLFANELERLTLSRAFDGLRVVDARSLPAEARPELLAKLSNTDRAVVLVDCPEQSVLATLLCASADALLLLAHQDETDLDAAKD